MIALKLSKLERVNLLKFIADSLTSDSDSDTIDPDILEELERRKADNSPTKTSAEVKARLNKKYGLPG